MLMGLVCDWVCVCAMERGIAEAGASPYCARCCCGWGCECFGAGGIFFSSFFSLGGALTGIGTASGGGVTGTAFGCGGGGAGEGCSVASTFGVGGVSCGSGIAGAELTRVAWIAPGALLLPHSDPRTWPSRY